MEQAAIRGCFRVARKFHAQAPPPAVLAVPLLAFMPIRWIDGSAKAVRRSTCAGSGSILSSLRAKYTGSAFHRRITARTVSGTSAMARLLHRVHEFLDREGMLHLVGV